MRVGISATLTISLQELIPSWVLSRAFQCSAPQCLQNLGPRPPLGLDPFPQLRLSGITSPSKLPQSFVSDFAFWGLHRLILLRQDISVVSRTWGGNLGTGSVTDSNTTPVADANAMCGMVGGIWGTAAAQGSPPHLSLMPHLPSTG